MDYLSVLLVEAVETVDERRKLRDESLDDKREPP
jgi:hypothetical protein